MSLIRCFCLLFFIAPQAVAQFTLTATVVADGIDLSWSSVTGAEGYDLYSCSYTGATVCTPDSTATYLGWITTTSYEHRNLSPGTNYRYQVTHYVGGTVTSNVAEATAPQPPPPPPIEILTPPSSPVDFAARGSESTIALSWKEPSWEGSLRFDAYTLYRAVGNSCGTLSEYKTGISPSTTYLEDTDVNPGQSYCYQLTASNLFGESRSTDAQTVKAVNLGDPRDLAITTGNTASIGLSWTAPPDDGGGPVDGYGVYRCEQFGTDACVPAYHDWVVGGEQYEDWGITKGTTYRYAVDAVRADIVSEKTNEVTFSPGTTAVVAIGPSSSERISLTETDGSKTTTKFALISADAGVPSGTLEVPTTVDASSSFFYVKVSSESAEGSSPSAPDGLVHAGDRVLRVVLNKLYVGPIKELPSALTVCIPLSGVADGVDLRSLAFYRTASDGLSWVAMDAVHRPGMVCGATRQVTRFAVFGRMAEQSTDPDTETPPAAGGAPTALTVTSISATAISLSWTAPAGDGGDPVEAYNVYRCQDGESACVLTAHHWIAWVEDGTTFTDTHDDSTAHEAGGTSPIVAGNTYRYAVAAYRTSGGDWSNEATATVEAATGPQFAEDANIGGLVFTAGVAIEPLTLPEATGGDIDATLNDGALSVYVFDPVDLPAGLTFNRFTRVMEGTPTRSLKKTDYTYWVHDDDEDYSSADSDSIGFTIKILAASSNAAQLLSEADQVLLDDVSASMARSMLSSVVPTIGSRFAASNSSQFSLAGRQLTMDDMAGHMYGGSARSPQLAADSRFDTYSGSYGVPQFHSPISTDRIGATPYADVLSGAPGVPAVRNDQVLGGDRLLRGSGFAARLSADSESGGQWMLWGKSDIQSFQSSAMDGGTYSGDVRTGYMGLDGRTGERTLVGVSVSHSLGLAEYAGADSSGTMEMEVTTVLPYARFAPDQRTEAWIILGAGHGERRTLVDGQFHESGELTPKLGAVGGRRKFESGIAGIDWEMRGDVEHMSLTSIYDKPISANRARFGLEGSSTVQFGSAAFARPFLEVGVRYDEGAGRHTGAGVELVGGVVFRHAGSGFWLEARGRSLVLHATEDYEESGFSVTVGLQPSADGTGLSLLLSPRWGGMTESSNAIWRDHGLNMAGPTGAMLQGEQSVRAEFAYGFLAPYSGAMVQPFGEVQDSGEFSRRARLGARFRRMTDSHQLELEVSSDVTTGNWLIHQDPLAQADLQYDFELRGNLRF